MGTGKARGGEGWSSVIYVPDLISGELLILCGLKARLNRAGKLDALFHIRIRQVPDVSRVCGISCPPRGRESPCAYTTSTKMHQSRKVQEERKANKSFHGPIGIVITEIQKKHNVFRRQRKETESEEREDNEMGRETGEWARKREKEKEENRPRKREKV